MAVGRVLLVRHGETEWSLARRHTGKTDLPLTPNGESQAAGLYDRWPELLPRGAALILCSPLIRAQRTAELAGLTPYELDADLVEWDYGVCEGLTRAEIQQTIPGWSVWRSRCPGGETADQVQARCDRVLTKIRAAGNERTTGDPKADPKADADADIVVVAHGHLLRALTARWLGGPVAEGERYELAAAAVSVLGYEHGTPVIRFWNLPQISSAQQNGSSHE